MSGMIKKTKNIQCYERYDETTRKFEYYEQYNKQDAMNNFSAISGMIKKKKNIECYERYNIQN